jgi:hypothetical protein
MEGINEFQLGDWFQVKRGESWLRFWNEPLRDQSDIAMAKDIVATKGNCLGYPSSPNSSYDTEFRSINPTHPEAGNPFMTPEVKAWPQELLR